MAEEINTQTAQSAPVDVDGNWDIRESEEPAEETNPEITPESKPEKDDAAAPEPEEADPQKPEEGEAETEKPEQDDEKQTDQFTLKHLDEVKTVSRDEVIALAQKGMDYDRVRQKMDDLTSANGTLSAEKEQADSRIALLTEIAHQNGYKDFDDFIDNVQAKQIAEHDGIDEAVALQKVQLDRRERELKAKETKIAEERESKTNEAETVKKANQKREDDFSEFAGSKYGKLKPEEIPKEVWDLYGDGNKGYSLLQAFTQVRAEKLEEELAAKKKNEENKSRSTGSQTSAGTPKKDKDPFVDGWNSI